MRKINVAHIITNLHFGGGVEQDVYTQAKNTDRSKFNLIVCCLDNKGYIAEKIKEQGYSVYCLRERFRYTYMATDGSKRKKGNRTGVFHTCYRREDTPYLYEFSIQ